jgi:NADPH2:quinone reductase
VSGIVREDAGGFRTGDRVAAMPVVVGFAETVALDTEMVFPLPDVIDPPIGEVFALDDVASALRAMDERRATGRLLVRVRATASGPPRRHRA